MQPVPTYRIFPFRYGEGKFLIACRFHKSNLQEFKQAIHYTERTFWYQPQFLFWELSPQGFKQLADAHGDKFDSLDPMILDLAYPCPEEGIPD